ncbi:MAG: hypothetical protein SFZ24_05265 [Planctomycetota bacterium]|nr:hypothetical protein [Planctomycetota bacterium]
MPQPRSAAADAPTRAHWLGRWPGALALVLLCLVAYAPGLFAVPPVDRDESRFALASAQMRASDTLRGWVVPMMGDVPRLNKPPLLYWLQAGSAAALDRFITSPGGIGPYRLPSALAATVAALLTWRLGLSMFPSRTGPLASAGLAAPARPDHRSAFLAAALLSTSLVVLWDARQARADQLLLACTTAAMALLWACWRRAAPRQAPTHAPSRPSLALCAAFWLTVALGIMAKGPITPMIAGLTALTLSAATGRWRWMLRLRPLLGVAIILVAALPWVVLVAREVGWQLYFRTIWDETLGRSVSPSEGHWGPPGYHLAMLPVMFWPGSMLTAAGLALAWRRARAAPQAPNSAGLRAWLGRFTDEHPAELFLLAWIAPSWLVFELVSTKLPHYTLPLYPALALLSARAVMIASTNPEAPRALGLHSAAGKLGLALWWIIGTLATVAGPILLVRWGQWSPLSGAGPLLFLGALIGAAAGLNLSILRALWKRSLGLAQVLAVTTALVGSATLFGVALPAVTQPWVSVRLHEIIRRLDPDASARIGAIGYHEDSLKFFTRGRLDRLGLRSLGVWLEGPPGILIVPADRAAEALALAGAPTAEPQGIVTGFNYSKAEPVDLHVYDLRPFRPHAAEPLPAAQPPPPTPKMPPE